MGREKLSMSTMKLSDLTFTYCNLLIWLDLTFTYCNMFIWLDLLISSSSTPSHWWWWWFRFYCRQDHLILIPLLLPFKLYVCSFSSLGNNFQNGCSCILCKWHFLFFFFFFFFLCWGFSRTDRYNVASFFMFFGLSFSSFKLSNAYVWFFFSSDR